ncbi:MAG: RNase adapter RapZ [Deltaproteobacteria bacterium]|nr:RNase adapter RapZ [Deltaproteobacteria bacterium]
MKNLRIVIITGLSGSGKSTALRALEDIGFFCVDNLPILLLPKFLEIEGQASGEVSKVALVMDIRERYFLEKHMEVISKLKKKKYSIEILFLEASDDSLLHRFSETRRAHPLSEKRTVSESITLEREKLRELKDIADNIIDTSLYNIHQLKDLLQRHYLDPLRGGKITINLISFGYRYGLPSDADMALDVRFLPNPYFFKDLKKYNGNDSRVKEYVLKWDDTLHFLDKIYSLLSFLIPRYEKEGKTYLTIAVGCTGGRHRSVVILNRISEFLLEKGYTIHINHRDMERQ